MVGFGRIEMMNFDLVVVHWYLTALIEAWSHLSEMAAIVHYVVEVNVTIFGLVQAKNFDLSAVTVVGYHQVEVPVVAHDLAMMIAVGCHLFEVELGVD